MVDLQEPRYLAEIDYIVIHNIASYSNYLNCYQVQLAC